MHYRADLHIHTVLSPCGSLEMTPVTIVDRAMAQGLHLIGITDHNTMRQCRVVQAVGRERGLTVWCGVEINTKEEVHCLAFFETEDQQDAFQLFLDDHLPPFINNPVKFGDQVWVDRDENILGQEDRMLIMGLTAGINQVADEVMRLNGIFIAAHVDRPMYSIISQLGFVDPRLPFDGIELSARCDRESYLKAHPDLLKYGIVTSSDAHTPQQVGSNYFEFEAENLSFEFVRKAIASHKYG